MPAPYIHKRVFNFESDDIKVSCGSMTPKRWALLPTMVTCPECLEIIARLQKISRLCFSRKPLNKKEKAELKKLRANLKKHPDPFETKMKAASKLPKLKKGQTVPDDSTAIVQASGPKYAPPRRHYTEEELKQAEEDRLRRFKKLVDDTVKLIQADSPQLSRITKKKVQTLYRQYSDMKASAMWIKADEKTIKDFVKWATTPPFLLVK